jgi:arylsulfatase A-like enzyme/tetratricopeptide (TPR) repeat protein
MGSRFILTVALALLCAAGCNRTPAPPNASTAVRPSILLVTLDTTRADAIGPEAIGVDTPAFNALAARGRRFRQAYATVPETLPSHSSMMTGLYPGGHGVHENGRSLSPAIPVIAERLQKAGYRTAAFVSSFVLARRFGIARGFELYDEAFPSGQSERTARQTLDTLIPQLGRPGPLPPDQPIFLWVHFNDPHAPYTPPEPFRTKYAAKPYLGEVASMDEQLGRLIAAFEQRARGPIAIAIVADHGEGLGEHGESQHGHLLYQSTMHVPLVLVGPGVAAGVSDTPVSTRRIFHTLLDWAGLGAEHSLRGAEKEPQDVTLGEGMKPFLEYGWQPQVMAVGGRYKAILAGKLETYDVIADPAESRDLGSGVDLPPDVRKALEDYPVPAPDVARAPENLDADARRRLASLGYVSAGAAPVVRKDAPRPAAMAPMLEAIEKTSGLFTAGQYAQVIPLLERILAADPYNLDAALRLATAHSALKHDEKAVEMFQKAAAIAPRSQDVRLYLALHYARGREWERAVPLLEQIVAQSPDRLTAVEALAGVQVHQGERAMDAGETPVAIDFFEKARKVQGAAFTHDLELGVLYLAARRFQEAKAALDRVPPTHREYPMALFKRAQVSVLLNEPDKTARIALARQKADATTKVLIARERLFAGR